ncbi:MAG: xanthine dehydrogenase family protein subunit M [Bryobacteraceae bacterium]|nr:xanthine dehydrogenase family protein subunit M [Bryobacteraceae bacterium]
MRSFDYAAPVSLAEALALLAAHPTARVLAGGTDLLVQLKSGRRETPLVVDLKKIPELKAITFDAAEGLTIGATVPCCQLTAHADLRRVYPSLAEVAGLIGGTAVQGRASLGGNLCNAAPSADSVPLMIALSAQARVAGPQGLRTVAVEDFCVAPGKSILGPGEFLVSIFFPLPAPGFHAHYLRFIPRNEMDIAVVGVGVSTTVQDGKIAAARIALASVAPTPLFVKAAGDSLVGQAPTSEAIAGAATLAQAAAKPISDMRAPADYRRHLCDVLTRRALTATLGAQ